MINKRKATLGLAFSGAGNRSTFYIGFLEVLAENNVDIDYISACSGGSLVSAAYVCGTLPILKNKALQLDFNTMKDLYLVKSRNGSGLYSLQKVAEDLELVTGGKTFEDVKTKLVFGAIDINSGEKVSLCMGSIAQAATVSCAFPGLFEPVKWGNKILVDAGLFTYLPSDLLSGFGPDVVVEINLQAHKYFATGRVLPKFFFHSLKKLAALPGKVKALLGQKHNGFEDDIFSVIEKSLQISLENENLFEKPNRPADLTITMKDLKTSKVNLSQDTFRIYYEEGRAYAEKYLPVIEQLLTVKSV